LFTSEPSLPGLETHIRAPATNWASRCEKHGHLKLFGSCARARRSRLKTGKNVARQFLCLLARDSRKDEQEVSICSQESPFMSACDPLEQAGKKIQSMLS